MIKKITFHIAWVFSLILLKFLLSSEACNNDKDKDIMNCQTLVTVYNESGWPCYICAGSESPGNANIIGSGGLRQYMEYYDRYEQNTCFGGQEGTEYTIKIYGNLGDLLASLETFPTAATTYYVWDGTTLKFKTK